MLVVPLVLGLGLGWFGSLAFTSELASIIGDGARSRACRRDRNIIVAN